VVVGGDGGGRRGVVEVVDGNARVRASDGTEAVGEVEGDEVLLGQRLFSIGDGIDDVVLPGGFRIMHPRLVHNFVVDVVEGIQLGDYFSGESGVDFDDVGVGHSINVGVGQVADAVDIVVYVERRDVPQFLRVVWAEEVYFDDDIFFCGLLAEVFQAGEEAEIEFGQVEFVELVVCAGGIAALPGADETLGVGGEGVCLDAERASHLAVWADEEACMVKGVGGEGVEVF